MSNQRQPTRPDLRSWRPRQSKPRSAYIHIPFCRHRCGYCNFSVVADRDYLMERFLDAIECEIGWLDTRYQLDTLFLGGGTPSHLPPSGLERLKEIVASRFDLVESAEITAECNPNDLTREKADALAEFGINRISLGVQSLNPGKLKVLERDHSADDVREAIKLAREFANSIAVDLIFAAPHESLQQWQQDVAAMLLLAPDHVSTYELTYEKGTQFWNRQLRGEFAASDEDLRADMYLAAEELMKQAGLLAYEISSYSKAGHASRHNDVYWTGLPFFAFGPGASRFIDGVRETNHHSTVQYLKRIESGHSAVALSEQLPSEDAARELLAIGLRRVAGVDLHMFQTRTGFRVEELISANVSVWIQNNLILLDENSIRLTQRGRLLGDHLATEIVNR